MVAVSMVLCGFCGERAFEAAPAPSHSFVAARCGRWIEEQEMNPKEDFLDAVKAGDTKRIEALLDSTPSLAAARNEAGVSAPLLALYYQKKDAAPVLLARKEALEPIDVFEAAAFGRSGRLSAILDGSPDLVNAYASDGFYPLGLAAFFGREDAVRLLLSRSADPNLAARNAMKVRALHAAAAAHSLSIAIALIDAGSDVNAPQQAGFTPLHEAAATGQLDLARLLLDRGAEVNAKTEDGRTALALARKANQTAMIELLASRGARD
jgi:ankyrin repeat protein